MNVMERGCLHREVGFILMPRNAGADTPITGPYREAAEKVREIMGGMSARAAENKVGVNHATINKMRNGHRAEWESVIKFAAGFRVPPNPLLIAFEFPAIEGGGEVSTAYITRIPDADYIPPPEGYSGLDGEYRQAAYEDFQDAVNRWTKRQRRRESIGGRITDDEVSNITRQADPSE